MSAAPDLEQTIEQLKHYYETASHVVLNADNEPTLTRSEFVIVPTKILFDAIQLLHHE